MAGATHARADAVVGWDRGLIAERYWLDVYEVLAGAARDHQSLVAMELTQMCFAKDSVRHAARTSNFPEASPS